MADADGRYALPAGPGAAAGRPSAPRTGGAVLSVYLAGLNFFAVRPGLRARRWLTAAGLGAAFGFVAYATYDLTNQATLRVWATRITVLDLTWGTFVSAVGATAGYFAAGLTNIRAA